MMAARLLLAAVVLLPFLVWRGGAREAGVELRAAWRPSLVLGVVNAALPFWLVAWGEQHVDSTIAGIAQASMPIFVLVLGLRFLPHEQVGLGRLAGIGLGIAGVAVLTGFNPDRGWWAVAGTLAVVLSSLSYATGAIYGQLRVRSVAWPVLAAGSLSDAAAPRLGPVEHGRT